MKLLRIKAVSLCLGIRRMKIYYTIIKDGEYDLKSKGHPLDAFKSFKILDDNIEINNTTNKILDFEETFTEIKREMKSLNDVVTEHIVLGFMGLNINQEMIPHYEKNIVDNLWFDDLNGEYEYLLGYLYKDIDIVKSEEYFKKSKEKGFIPETNN